MNTSLLQQYIYWNVCRNEPGTPLVHGRAVTDYSTDVQIHTY